MAPTHTYLSPYHHTTHRANLKTKGRSISFRTRQARARTCHLSRLSSKEDEDEFSGSPPRPPRSRRHSAKAAIRQRRVVLSGQQPVAGRHDLRSRSRRPVVPEHGELRRPPPRRSRYEHGLPGLRTIVSPARALSTTSHIDSLESCVGGLQRLDLLLGDTCTQRNACGVNDRRGLDEHELDGVWCDDQVR